VKIHCSVLAEDAIRAAIVDVKAKQGAETATAR
jgi:NifU-like protein involved in Fe-S cluster formation